MAPAHIDPPAVTVSQVHPLIRAAANGAGRIHQEPSMGQDGAMQPSLSPHGGTSQPGLQQLLG